MLCMAHLSDLIPSTLLHVHHAPDLLLFFEQAMLMPSSAPLQVPCLLP